jgi:hypothetical protein
MQGPTARPNSSPISTLDEHILQACSQYEYSLYFSTSNVIRPALLIKTPVEHQSRGVSSPHRLTLLNEESLTPTLPERLSF